jgi:hypothetical protein
MRLSFIAGMLLIYLPAFAISPILVHSTASENSRGQSGVSSVTTLFQANVENVAFGNCLGIAFAFNYGSAGTPVLTVSDDKSDTFYQIPQNPYDSVNARKAQVWMTPPISSAAHFVTVDFSANASGQELMHAIVFEVSNCGSTSGAIDDGDSSTVLTSATVAAGSFTPGTAGDLLLQFAWVDSTPTSVPALSGGVVSPGTNTGITWRLQHVELLDGLLMQYGTYSLTSAINPTMTAPASSTLITIAFAIKGASGGSTPSAMYINSIQHVSLWATAQGGYGYSNPSVTQFPAIGNLMVVAATGNCDITGITYGGTSLNKRVSFVGAGANETQQFCTLDNYTPNNSNTISITPNLGCSGNGAGATWTLVFYDIVGAAVAPYDTFGTASGDQTTCSGSCSISGAPITPTTTSGLILTETSEFFNQVISVSGPFVTDTLYDNQLYQSPPLDQQNGWGHIVNTSTSTQTPTWNYLGSSLPLGYWAAASIALKAASVPGPPGTYMLIGEK